MKEDIQVTSGCIIVALLAAMVFAASIVSAVIVLNLTASNA